ncbi:uncharacterized protein G2W53_039413 [Senna tora]|uniref:Uncharacterized protein n=1 Tax=Senna tora TaxID=362788 RepID=A0A834SNW1_9FABA|nr:uncharacterized protein G2W53_039413 [Senna tora]
MVRRLVHLEGPRYILEGSDVSKSSIGSHTDPRCQSQCRLAPRGDAGPSREGTSSRDHESRVADSEAIPSGDKDVLSSPPFEFDPDGLD